MFQTDLNHFLQAFASDELTAFMRGITALGYAGFLLMFIIILLFGVDFKKAFILFVILMWTGSITYFFKDYFSLPRPFHVDNSLTMLDGDLPDETSFSFHKRGAITFWSGLPTDVLEITRQAKDIEHGFPSGHSSVAIALWGALIFLFRKRWISIVCLAVMILIPISRIYLGVHFLADVLSGIAVGAIVLAIFHWLILHPDKLGDYLIRDQYIFGLNMATLLLVIAPMLFFLLLPTKVYVLIAYTLGFGIGFMLIAQKGLPHNPATIVQRIQRTMVAILIFVIISALSTFVLKSLGLSDHIWAQFMSSLVSSIILIWGGVEIGIRLGWFVTNRDKIRHAQA